MEKTAKDLETMAGVLEELQLALEPVRDKALDQRAFYTGYSQCAEQMIKVIVSKMEGLRNEAKLKETEELVKDVEEEVQEVEPEKPAKPLEAPLIVDEKKDEKKRNNNNRRRKRKPNKPKEVVEA